MELILLEMERNIQKREQDLAVREANREVRVSSLGRIGCFAVGVVLVGTGVADALANPFAFIEAPKLLASGVALMIVGATGKKSGGAND